LKQFKRLFVRCLLFFYFSASYLSATHIHSDALKSHDNCKICIVVKNLNGGDGTTPEVDNLVNSWKYEAITFEIKKIEETLLKGFNANAPPKFS